VQCTTILVIPDLCGVLRSIIVLYIHTAQLSCSFAAVAGQETEEEETGSFNGQLAISVFSLIEKGFFQKKLHILYVLFPPSFFTGALWWF
jgi:hypothetical protein